MSRDFAAHTHKIRVFYAQGLETRVACVRLISEGYLTIPVWNANFQELDLLKPSLSLFEFILGVFVFSTLVET